MARHVKIGFTGRQLEAVQAALESDIPTRYDANRDEIGKRIETGPDSIDAIVPAQEEALAKIKEARDA